jgi:AcrR family transcriptional regulator
MGAISERKRTSKPPEERREDILDAAVRIFADRGIGSATIADITRAAGVAKGTFYLYFDSREQLVWALKERMVDEILAHASSLYEQVGRQDWWALVDTFGESYVDFMLEHRDMVHVMAQEQISLESDPPFSDCYQKIHEMLTAGLRAGIEAGVFSSPDPELTARLLHHAIDGIMVHALLYEPEVDRDRLVAAIRDLLKRAVAPMPAADTA